VTQLLQARGPVVMNMPGLQVQLPLISTKTVTQTVHSVAEAHSRQVEGHAVQEIVPPEPIWR
jgi:hypothetical protein